MLPKRTIKVPFSCIPDTILNAMFLELPDRVDLLKTVPALPVKDVAKAAEFHRGQLGFEIGHTDESLGIVTRSGIEIPLWAANDEAWSQRTNALASRPVVRGAESFLAGTASCRIEVRGIDELRAPLVCAGS
jgi:hypothetical protein